jgi:hypothetical protein
MKEMQNRDVRGWCLVHRGFFIVPGVFLGGAKVSNHRLPPALAAEGQSKPIWS